MNGSRTPLLIPSEIRAREFDAKLLLACLATERGFTAIVGSRVEMHLEIARLPRGIYLAKDVRFSSRRIFETMRKLDIPIVALDEEALLFYSRQSYLNRRVSEPVLRHVRELYAWGPENAAAWHELPCHDDTPIYTTGNPRVDMMRPELRPFHSAEVEEIRDRHGKFILVNTNFGSLNHYVPNLTTVVHPDYGSVAGSAGEVDFRRGLAAHRHEVFRRLRAFVPQLCKAFPEHRIVIRPHPAESPDIWRQAGEDMPNLRVEYGGGVIPWLLATEAVIHNSCTTGFEAYLVGTPVVAFRPVASDDFDLRLPNELSHEARSESEVIEILRAAVSGKLDNSDQDRERRERLIEQYVAGTHGKFASEQILDHLDAFEAAILRSPRSRVRRVSGRLMAEWRRVQKLRNAGVPGHKNNIDYTRHRFPTMALEEVNLRIKRLKQTIDRFPGAHARQLSENIFLVSDV